MRYTLLLFAAFLFVSCNNTPKDETQNASILENINRGVFKVYAEENTQYLMNQIIQVYTHRFPEATIDITYTDDKTVMDRFLADSARIIVMQRELDEVELDKVRRAFDNTRAEQTTIAYDAIALVRPKEDAQKVYSLEQVKSWVKAGNTTLVTVKAHLDAYKHLLYILDVKEGFANIEVVENLEELQKYLSLQPEKVGLLPFYLVSDQDDDAAKAVAQMFSRPGIAYAHEGRTDTVFPSQSTIFTKEWPLIKTFTIISCKIGRMQGFGFINFCHTRQIKKLIVKSGLIPYRMPERVVEVIPENL